MKIIVDEVGEIIAKASDDHILIGGHHRLAVAASLGKRVFWRDTGRFNLGRRWSSRLVTTAAEDRLAFGGFYSSPHRRATQSGWLQ